MRKINYKLIVSDFDGTLIDDKQEISEKVKHKIAEYVAAGGIFAVCTGRILKSILPIVRGLDLKGLVIANQGAVIADIESGEIIKCTGINYNEAANVCSLLESMNQDFNIYCGDKIYTDTPKDNEYLKIYERIIGVETEQVKGKLSDFVKNNKLSCQKIACLVSESKRDELYKTLHEELADRFDVTCSAKVLVEVSKLGETKGEAVKFLCNRLNIPIDKCVACGDNLNDLSMIRVAGMGVAVKNGDNALKSEADFISVSNNEGAIAQIIEKFGFA